MSTATKIILGTLGASALLVVLLVVNLTFA